jgi:AcrR family transcriptional regulator
MTGSLEERRNDLRSAEDVQARDTRRRLTEAYRQAVEQRRERPSVTWLCKQSGVARSTYYTHFATVEDLAVHCVTEALADVSEVELDQRTGHRQDRATITRTALIRTVETLEQNREVLEHAIGLGSRGAILERLTDQIVIHTRRTVDAEYPQIEPAEREVIAQFIGAGTVHVILRWMHDGAISRDQLVTQLVGLYPGGITAGRSS